MLIDNAFGEIHEPAAFGIDRPVVFNPLPNCTDHRPVGAQFFRIQLRVASAKVESVQFGGKLVVIPTD